MQCPVCTTTDNPTHLAMMDRQGIEVDYCPDCRGIWLDRGELDRLIARAEQDAPAPPRAPAPLQPYGHERPPAYGHHDSHKHRDSHRHGKKPKSLLGELFDF